MSGFNIYFIGLINFFDTNSGKLALIPDGRSPDGNIAPHFASFAIEDEHLEKDQTKWWASQQLTSVQHKQVTQFSIAEPSRITISGVSGSGCRPFQRGGGVNSANHDPYIPKLRVIDPAIRIIPEKACTIAQMPINSGVLEAFFFGKAPDGKKHAIVSRLAVDGYDGPITITATTDKCGMTRKIVLKPESDIVLVNISSPFDPHDGEENHFRIYGQLDVNRKNDKLAEPDGEPDITQLPFTNRYLDLIIPKGGIFPLPNCSYTGCCAGEIDC
jgi:hypothetical protein